MAKLKNPKLEKDIRTIVYPQLRKNPFFGQNIKKLKGKFENVYRFRFRSFRLFYTINQNKVIVIMNSLKKRKDAYN
jgi:mRNA interferase RelE/StbE